ncbi:MAG: prepilin peptidase [Planctomycetia bacterium]|nr:prepilin peptidase [Planctomycetia bacterium]
MELFYIICAGILGGAIGSFLNVVIWRIPEGMSLITPPSHCPKCGHQIRVYDNVPVFGWIFLGGKCRDCRQPISLRYPLVEAICMVIPIFLASAFLIRRWSFPSDTFFHWTEIADFWKSNEQTWKSMMNTAGGDLVAFSELPIGILQKSLFFTFLLSGFFYFMLIFGLIESDGKKVPNSILCSVLIFLIPVFMGIGKIAGNADHSAFDILFQYFDFSFVLLFLALLPFWFLALRTQRKEIFVLFVLMMFFVPFRHSGAWFSGKYFLLNLSAALMIAGSSLLLYIVKRCSGQSVPGLILFGINILLLLIQFLKNEV